MSKIIRLTVNNILRIKAAEVEPKGDALVIVAGNNDQGKSSLLNSIAIALSGKNLPEKPIREGTPKGSVVLVTESLVVTRTFSQSGANTLEVRDAEGKPITSPQAKLDELVSRVTFDPLEFIRLKPDAQLATLKKIVGLDFTELDADYAAKFAKRTDVGRDKRQQDGILAGTHRYPDAPEEEVSVSALTQELNKATEANRANDDERNRLAEMNDIVDEAETRRERAEKEVERLTAELQRANQALTEAGMAKQQCISQRDEMKAKVDALSDIDTAPILEKLANADSTNQRVRANQKWTETHKKTLALGAEYDALTEAIDAITKQKQDALSAAEFPIQGLGFADAGVTFDGHPFEQASSSVKIRVSLAIACALNPKLPVMLIRDGSLLDAKSLKLVEEFAESHKAQVWIECVGERDDATVVIEDGSVIAEPKKANRKK